MNAAAACSFNAGAKNKSHRPWWLRWMLVFVLLWASMSSTAWAVNAWESVGPGGGTILALVISNDGQTIIAGTEGSGIFKSANGGTSWAAISNGLTNLNVISLALSSDGQTIFAGTQGGGVFKSTNGGSSWAAVNNGLNFQNVYALALSTDGQTIFAGTNGGVFKSTNGGTFWAVMNNGLTIPFVLSMGLSGDGQTIIASTNGGGLFKSTDGGASWAAVNNGLNHSIVLSLALSSDGQTIVAGTLGGGAFKTTNGGASWTAVNNGLVDGYVTSLALSSDGQTIVAGTYNGAFKTTDGGTSWAAVNSGLTIQDVRSLVLSSDGQTIFAGTSGGAFRTTNGGASWAAVNTGLNNQGVPAVALSSDGQTVVAGTYGDGVFKSTNGGTSWAAFNSGLNSQDVRSLALSTDGQTIFAGTNGAGVFKSINGGTSWVALNNGLTNQFVYSLALSSDGQTIFAGTYGGGVFKTTNGTTSWTPVNNGLTIQDVRSLALSSDGQTIFAGTQGGVFKSTNGAISWTAFNNGLTIQNVPSLALSSDGQTVFAGVLGGGVFKATNGATSWSAVNMGLTNQFVLSLALSGNGQTIFAGTQSGVFKSSNSGNSWAAANAGLAGLPSPYVPSLALGNGGQTIFAGTSNFSVFKSTNGALSSDSRLLDLTLVANGSPVALSPTFSSNALNYSATVQGASVTLTPTAWISDQTITLNGAPASSGPAFTVALDPGTNVIAVKVTSGDETSTRTYTITITRQIVAPAAPTNVQAALGVPGSGQASVSWTAPASSGTSVLTGYTVTGSPGGSCSAGPGQTSCIVSGLNNGTAYGFTVTATNAEGASTGSATSNSVTPQNTQTINFPAQGSQSFTTGGSFAIDPATASSGLGVTYGSLSMGVCTVSGATVTVVSAGTCMLTANQGGNAAWLPAVQATQNLVINKGTNTITFPAQSNQTYSAGGTFAFSAASATSGLAVTYTSLTTGVCTVAGSTVSMQGAGTCTIAANQGGDANWAVATQATQIISIAKGLNTITFGAQADQTYSLNGAFAVHPVATAASGLAVTYSSLTTGVCNLSGSMVVMQTAGTCMIAADQAGDANWEAAAQVTQNVNILAVTPGAPTNVQATPTASGQVTVTWTPPAQTGGGITGYVVTAQPGGNTCSPTPATATACTFAGLVNGQTYTFTVEALNQAGSSTPPTPSNPATPLADSKSFSSITPTGSGTLTATVTGGGSTCRFEHVRVMAVGDAATAPPASLSFPHGLLNFVLAGCDPTDATLTLTYPSALPQGVRYWKLNAGTWAPYSHAVAQPGTSTVTLTLRDGGQGDDDGQVNGRIVDPGQVGVMASTLTTPTPVPALSTWGLTMLGLALAWLGVGRRRLVKT